MKPEVIKTGRELGEKAHKRPWEKQGAKVFRRTFPEFINDEKIIGYAIFSGYCDEDVEYIAHACNNYIPALDHIERQNKKITEAKVKPEDFEQLYTGEDGLGHECYIHMGGDEQLAIANHVNKILEALKGGKNV